MLAVLFPVYFQVFSLSADDFTHTHTHTHTYIYICKCSARSGESFIIFISYFRCHICNAAHSSTVLMASLCICVYVRTYKRPTHVTLPVPLQTCALFVLFYPWDFKPKAVKSYQPGKDFIEKKICFV